MTTRTLVCVAAGLWLVHTPTPAAAQPDPKELGRAAVQGYRQHWDRFEHFRIRFHQWGYAGDPPTTLDDALAFRWKKSKGLMCEYAVDGPAWVFKVDGDDPPLDPKKLVKDKKNPGIAWADAPNTQRYLGKAGDSFNYTPSTKLGALWEGGKGEQSGARISSYTPLHLLGYRNPELNPYDLLVAAERDQKPWSADPPVDVNGSPCVPVAFQNARGAKVVLYLDLRRGYLPARIQEYHEIKGKETECSRTEVLEIRECSRGRWLPTKVRCLNFPECHGIYQPSYRDILEFDLDNRPTRDQMTVEMEAGTSITRQSKPKAEYGILLRQGERVHPDDLARFIDISEGRKVNPRTDTAIHPAPTWKWWWYAGPAAVAAAALAVGYRRYRRGRSATA